MTLDELMKVYDKAASDVAFLQYEGTDHRAGIRAVVEALRDEFIELGSSPFLRHMTGKDLHEASLSWINEILASDGVEAEGSE
jgi:hypothetical protein